MYGGKPTIDMRRCMGASPIPISLICKWYNCRGQVKYHDTGNFIDSTAAARVNGHIVGYGSVETSRENLGDLGLSQEGNDRLLATAAIWGDKMTNGEFCATQ
jgi:hypothetical protein